MAVYTDISDVELDAFLAEFDLGQATAFKGIAEGVSNSNFLLETDRGRFILTVYEARTKVDDLPFFLNLLRWLAEHGYPCAPPMPAKDGSLSKTVRGKPAAIVPFLSGRAVRRPTVAHCREAIASYKKPRHVLFRATLPRNAVGKVLKHELAAEARAELATGRPLVSSG